MGVQGGRRECRGCTSLGWRGGEIPGEVGAGPGRVEVRVSLGDSVGGVMHLVGGWM